MKRSVVILCFILLLTGCSSSMEQDCNRLKRNGYTLTQNCTTNAELKTVSDSLNAEIVFKGGSFTVDVVHFSALRKVQEEDLLSCQFIVFADTEQARQYCQLLIDSRSMFYRVALQDTLVILTNSEEVTDLLDYDFQ